MSTYLLLLEKNECPKCRRLHQIPVLYGQCRKCGMWLFDSSNNFKKFESDSGWREYYVWTGKQCGWKHRSFIFDESAKPLSREYVAPKLSDDYGTDTMVKRNLDNSRIELKQELKKRKKKPVTVRKIR